MSIRTPVRTAMFPLRLSWAIANKAGLLADPPIGNSPYLHPDALEFWRKTIARTDIYLEYGAGGSTIEASHSVKQIISVETDARYLDLVKQKLASEGGPAQFNPVRADIGLTSQWGQPVLDLPTASRRGKWRRYPAAPWVMLKQRSEVPDFIVVDGRFRAASVLQSFLELPDGSKCQFLLDDFKSRASRYQPCLTFADDIRSHGTAVSFVRHSRFDRDECESMLEKMIADPL